MGCIYMIDMDWVGKDGTHWLDARAKSSLYSLKNGRKGKHKNEIEKNTENNAEALKRTTPNIDKDIELDEHTVDTLKMDTVAKVRNTQIWELKAMFPKTKYQSYA